MSKESIISSLTRAQFELNDCKKKEFHSAVVPLEVLEDVIKSHEALQQDVEDLAIKYTSLIKSSTELFFWAQVACSSARPAKKSRCLVSDEAMNKLTEAVNKHAKVEVKNRLSDQPINLVT
jgi:hypothetical protein